MVLGGMAGLASRDDVKVQGAKASLVLASRHVGPPLLFGLAC